MSFNHQACSIKLSTLIALILVVFCAFVTYEVTYPQDSERFEICDVDIEDEESTGLKQPSETEEYFGSILQKQPIQSFFVQNQSQIFQQRAPPSIKFFS